MWTLRAVPLDPDHPLTFRLLPGNIRTIGRGAGATFVVDAPLISRVHCRLTVGDDGVVEVLDLGSTNGTWIDGREVLIGHLTEGQVLRVGRVEFMLERDNAPAAARADEPEPGPEPAPETGEADA
jgi:pSer/pThr/pTyr-binding forkhead associated (FHA) protein